MKVAKITSRKKANKIILSSNVEDWTEAEIRDWLMVGLETWEKIGEQYRAFLPIVFNVSEVLEPQLVNFHDNFLSPQTRVRFRSAVVSAIRVWRSETPHAWLVLSRLISLGANLCIEEMIGPLRAMLIGGVLDNPTEEEGYQCAHGAVMALGALFLNHEAQMLVQDLLESECSASMIPTLFVLRVRGVPERELPAVVPYLVEKLYRRTKAGEEGIHLSQFAAILSGRMGKSWIRRHILSCLNEDLDSHKWFLKAIRAA